MYGAFLIDPTFWSRIGFLISYVATSLIALEVVRLVYTDANKRDVEKFLESYSKQRAASPPRGRTSPSPKKISVPIADLETRSPSASKRVSVNIDDLQSGRSVTPPAPVQAQRHIRAESTEKTERRKRAPSSASQHQRTASPTPIRKLRKRSDTLTSTGSSESKRPSSRRHREASPASEVSDRHASPRRSREERKLSGLGLGKVMRAKV